MSAAALVRELEAAGGSLRLVGGEVKAMIPPGAATLLPQLREHKAEIVELLESSQPRHSDMAAVELVQDEIGRWDYALHVWTQARCAWRERSWGSLSKLYESQVAWAHQTGQPFAPDAETFMAILMSLGFHVDGGMVYGLIFKADANAVLNAGGNRR